MVAVHIGTGALPRHVKLLSQPHTLVTLRACRLGEGLRRDRRGRVDVRFYKVNAVTISAHRRLPVAPGERLAMNALAEFG